MCRTSNTVKLKIKQLKNNNIVVVAGNFKYYAYLISFFAMTVIYYQKITGIIQTIITVTYLTSIAHKPVLFRTQEIIKIWFFFYLKKN